MRRRRPRNARTIRPCCPTHGVRLLVRRTIDDVQYRYCTVPGCCETLRTRRPVRAGEPLEPICEGAPHE
jgi:hypothetical protein